MKDNTLLFEVKGQYIVRLDSIEPVAKCRNLYKAQFQFKTDEWTETKTALFVQGEYSKSVILDENGTCEIPWEFFDSDNTTFGYVSVYCGDLVTANRVVVDIVKSGYQESDASVPPSPDVYQQLVKLAEDTKEIAQSVRDDADNCVFDGEEGYSPKVSLTEELDGVTVTVQNKDGQQSAKVKNGKDGKDYEHSEEFTKLAEQVRQDKSSVEQTVQGFGNTAQQAIQSVQSAGTQAVGEVNATKTDAVEAVQTEGEKQAQAVEAKGQEVINSIPSDFTTRMATKLDKQQGVEHAGKALVIGDDGNVVPGEPTQQIEVDKTLTQERQAADAKATGDKILQYAIKNTASGEGIVRITDSADEKLLDFAMQGKTEQLTTEGKNLFDIDEFLKLPLEQFSNYGNARVLIITLKPNTAYTMHTDNTGSLTGEADVSRSLYFTSVDDMQINDNTTGVFKGHNITKTSDETGKLKIVLMDRKNAIPIVNKEKYVMLAEGSTALPYEPYTGGQPSPSQAYPQEITSSGKLNADTDKYEVNVQISSGNIFDVDAVRNENGYLNSDSQKALDTNCFDIVEGRQYLLISKGRVLTSGTGYSSPYFGEDNLHYSSNHLDILGKEPGYQMFTNNERRKVILKAKKSTTITKFIVHGYNRVNDAYEVEEMGLFETSNNNTNIDYVAYKGLQKVQFQLDRPLTKWDRIEKRDGVWGVVHKSKEVVFNGSEDEVWRNQTDSSGNTQFYTDLKDCPIKHVSDFVDNFYCDKFTKSSKASGDIAIGEVRYGSFGAAFAPVFKPKHEVGTLLLWRDLLKENPITILYETNSEEFVPLPQETQTALNALHTYYPTTVMSNSEDCEMEVTYVCDTKNYIDNKFKELQQATISTNLEMLERRYEVIL